MARLLKRLRCVTLQSIAVYTNQIACQHIHAYPVIWREKAETPSLASPGTSLHTLNNLHNQIINFNIPSKFSIKVLNTFNNGYALALIILCGLISEANFTPIELDALILPVSTDAAIAIAFGLLSITISIASVVIAYLTLRAMNTENCTQCSFLIPCDFSPVQFRLSQGFLQLTNLTGCRSSFSNDRECSISST